MEYYDSITGELVTTTTTVEKKKVAFKQIPKNSYPKSLEGITEFIKDDFENPTRKTTQAVKKLIVKYKGIIGMLEGKDYAKHLENVTIHFPFNRIMPAAEAYESEMGMPYTAAMKEVREEIIAEIETRLKGNKHENPHPSRLIVGAVEKLMKLESGDGADKHECECGCIISSNKQVVDKHKKSKKHVELMNRLNPEYSPDIKRTGTTWWQCECGEIHRGDEFKYKRHLKTAKCRDKRDVYMQALGKYVFEAKILSDAEAEELLKARTLEGMSVGQTWKAVSITRETKHEEYEDDEDAAAITADTYDQVINDLQQLDFYSDASSEGTQSCTPSPPPMMEKTKTQAERTLDLKARIKAAEEEEIRYRRQKVDEAMKIHKSSLPETEKSWSKLSNSVRRNPPSKVDIDEDVKCECGCYVRKSFMDRHLLDEIHEQQMNIIAEEAMYAAEEEYYNQGLIPPTSNNVVLEIKDPLVF